MTLFIYATAAVVTIIGFVSYYTIKRKPEYAGKATNYGILLIIIYMIIIVVYYSSRTKS